MKEAGFTRGRFAQRALILASIISLGFFSLFVVQYPLLTKLQLNKKHLQKVSLQDARAHTLTSYLHSSLWPIPVWRRHDVLSSHETEGLYRIALELEAAEFESGKRIKRSNAGGFHSSSLLASQDSRVQRLLETVKETCTEWLLRGLPRKSRSFVASNSALQLRALQRRDIKIRIQSAWANVNRNENFNFWHHHIVCSGTKIGGCRAGRSQDKLAAVFYVSTCRQSNLASIIQSRQTKSINCCF